MSDPPAVPADARRVTVSAARLSKWLDGFADRHGDVHTMARDQQVVVQAADESIAWIEVPFPPLVADPAGPLASLVLHTERSRLVGVLLVRRGGHAAGVFDGRTLISSKVGSSYVQGTTKAGGWSQQRYARRRDNQARAAIVEAAEVAARILAPEAGRLDAVVCGGDRAAVDAVLSDRALAQVRELVTGPWLNVGDPRLRILQAAPDQFLAVSIALHP